MASERKPAAMNIDTVKRKNGIVFRARVGSGPNRAIKYFQRKSDAHVWVAEMRVRKAAELGQVVTTLPTKEEVPGSNPISLAEAYELFSKGYAEIQQEPGTRIREAKIVEQHLKPHFAQRDLSGI